VTRQPHAHYTNATQKDYLHNFVQENRLYLQITEFTNITGTHDRLLNDDKRKMNNKISKRRKQMSRQ